MTQTYDQWIDRKHEPGTSSPDFSQVRLAVLGAVHAEKLTSNDVWDQFLKYLAGGREACQEALESRQRMLLSPHTVAHEDVLRAKLAITEMEGQIRALDWVMELPKSIMETGEIARELLEDAPEEK